MDLVTDHMLQALIVSRIEEDHDLKALACKAIVHHFVAVALIAQAMQLVRDVLDSLALEWSSISFVTVERGDFTEDGFNQVTNRHTRRDSVRIDNHVWYHTLASEWQVFLSVSHTASSFLSVPTSEFITDLWNLDRSHLHFNETAHLFVASQNNLVDVAFFRVLERDGPILVRLCVQSLLSQLVELLSHWNNLADDDVITTDLRSRTDDSILVKLVIGAMLAT